MAEKKLLMTFTTAGGGQTTMTLSGCKQDLNDVAVKGAMQSMVDAACFATEKGAAYTAPYSAEYVEEITTPIFSVEDEEIA